MSEEFNDTGRLQHARTAGRHAGRASHARIDAGFALDGAFQQGESDFGSERNDGFGYDEWSDEDYENGVNDEALFGDPMAGNGHGRHAAHARVEDSDDRSFDGFDKVLAAPAEFADGDALPPLEFDSVADEGYAMPAETVKEVPEEIVRFRKRRRKLRLIIFLLVVVIAALAAGFVFLMMHNEDAGTRNSAESEVIQSDANDATSDATKRVEVVNLVDLIRQKTDKAISACGHGGQVTASGEEPSGSNYHIMTTVTLMDDPSDTRTGQPCVYLYSSWNDEVIRAGYSCGTGMLGLSASSFEDAVKSGIVEQTLTEAGIQMEKGKIKLPEKKSAYATYDADGKTLTKEMYTWEGQESVNGKYLHWEAVLLYDYITANATGNLANTVRQIYVYVYEY